MASDETWSKLKFFKKDSNVDIWGDTNAINDTLLQRLDDFRGWLGVPIFVTAGVKGTGHATKSFHYATNGACAVDVIIPDYMESPFDLIMDATRFGFTGIGYYPHWRWKGEMAGGLHLDTRPLRWDADGTNNYSHSRWMGVLVDGKQTYIELDFQNMLKYCSYDSVPMRGLH